jgi:hypothetical protein
MGTIRIAVRAVKLSLYPQGSGGRPRTVRAGAQRLRALANGLAVPSFWTDPQITEAFRVANRVWAQAEIEFAPVTICPGSATMPADEDGMWIALINQLSPRNGIAAGFVHDLPSNEGGWGGGRIAIVAGKRADGALEGYRGRILAHELGHVLLGEGHELASPSNLMFDRRHPRVVSADILESEQITRARTRAQALSVPAPSVSSSRR